MRDTVNFLKELPKEKLDRLRKDWIVDNDDFCFTESNLSLATVSEIYWELDRDNKLFEKNDPLYPIYRIEQLLDLVRNKGYEIVIGINTKGEFLLNIVKGKEERNLMTTNLWLELMKFYISIIQ
ncbi:hypothetical protein [Clostridium perfringens]|uniref:hypothetical protein n=1 Tax=Clostridium perfringens TaxID=1502 RepID=UPI0024BD37A8|nr:hypothetical protein [Clostridium perfringens]